MNHTRVRSGISRTVRGTRSARCDRARPPGRFRRASDRRRLRRRDGDFVRKRRRRADRGVNWRRAYNQRSGLKSHHFCLRPRGWRPVIRFGTGARPVIFSPWQRKWKRSTQKNCARASANCGGFFDLPKLQSQPDRTRNADGIRGFLVKPRARPGRSRGGLALARPDQSDARTGARGGGF